MSLMNQKNSDMIDNNYISDLIDLRTNYDKLHFLWVNKGSKIHSMSSAEVLDLIEKEVERANDSSLFGDLEEYGKVHFPHMGQHRRHSFPRSARLNPEYEFKLKVIQKSVDIDFKQMVLDIIDIRYAQVLEHKKKNRN